MAGTLDAAILCYTLSAESASYKPDPKLLMLLNGIRVAGTGRNVKNKLYVLIRISALERRIKKLQPITNLFQTAVELLKTYPKDETHVQFFIPNMDCFIPAENKRKSVLNLDD